MNPRTRARCVCLCALMLVGCGKRQDPPAPAASSAAVSSAVAYVPTLVQDASNADAASAPDAQVAAGYGNARTAMHATCNFGGGAGAGALRISRLDAERAYPVVSDLLAIVNRSPYGALGPDDAPADLVELASLVAATPARCETVPCLRAEAAAALLDWRRMLGAEHIAMHVESSYRSYAAQCATFANWAAKGGFCAAAEQSALAGHSQHQLGTTADLFTEKWRQGGNGEVFRDGFGCTAEAARMHATSADFGFVLAYPIHPEDRTPGRACAARYDARVGIHPITGYRSESWHFRYLGKPAAQQFRQAVAARDGLDLETWLRERAGIAELGAAELPVCDGCNCGACASFDSNGPCGQRALLLGAAAAQDTATPTALLESAVAYESAEYTEVRARVKLSGFMRTQPPLFERNAGYAQGTDFMQVAYGAGAPAHAYPPLAGAIRLAIASAAGTDWPHRFALTRIDAARIYNKINVVLPAEPGTYELRVRVPRGAAVRAALVQGATTILSELAITQTTTSEPHSGAPPMAPTAVSSPR